MNEYWDAERANNEWVLGCWTC